MAKVSYSCAKQVEPQSPHQTLLLAKLPDLSRSVLPVYQRAADPASTSEDALTVSKCAASWSMHSGYTVQKQPQTYMSALIQDYTVMLLDDIACYALASTMKSSLKDAAQSSASMSMFLQSHHIKLCLCPLAFS